MILYEWVSPRGKAEFTEWRTGLQTAEKAILDSHTTALRDCKDLKLLPGMITGPIIGFKGIYKLQLGGRIRLRPLLCKGPQDKNAELTFLKGAMEKGGNWSPSNAPKTALDRKVDVEKDEGRRKKYGIQSKTATN